jgi:hypothetical protein
MTTALMNVVVIDFGALHTTHKFMALKLRVQEKLQWSSNKLDFASQ